MLEKVFYKIWNYFDEFGGQTYRLSIWIMSVARAVSRIPHPETIAIDDIGVKGVDLGMEIKHI
ncbi:MAG: hypothetical protein ABI203_00755 [Mucilaginibacter sp.]